MNPFQTCNLIGREKLGGKNKKQVSAEMQRKGKTKKKMVVYQEGTPCGNKC